MWQILRLWLAKARAFAQDDRVVGGWRRTNTGISPLRFGRDDSVYGGANEEREDAEILREAQNDGFGGRE